MVGWEYSILKEAHTVQLAPDGGGDDGNFIPCIDQGNASIFCNVIGALPFMSHQWEVGSVMSNVMPSPH